MFVSSSNVVPLRASPRLLSWVAAMAEALALPVLLLRGDGALVQANMAGYGELGRAQWLVLHGGQVLAARVERRDSLAAALQQAAQQCRRIEWPIESDALADAASGQRVVIAPLTSGQGTNTLMLVLPAQAPLDEACRLFAYQYGLSENELAVLVALCQGHTPRQISSARGVSPSTVHRQLARVRRKCGEDLLGTLLPRIHALPPLVASR